MAVTTFHDFPLAPRDRAWNGAAAEKRMRAWAGAQDKPNGKYRDAHLWYDAASKENFTAYKLLFTDVVDGRQVAVPRAIMAAQAIVSLGIEFGDIATQSTLADALALALHQAGLKVAPAS